MKSVRVEALVVEVEMTGGAVVGIFVVEKVATWIGWVKLWGSSSRCDGCCI